MRCLLFWTPGPAVSGERAHVCESGLSGSMGEAGKTGHVCVHPCGPHLRASGKHREAVTPRTPAPCPFLLALSCPGGARGQKGPRGALVHRAGQRHRPTPTDAARPVRRPAARISGDSRLFPGLMTPGTLPLSPRPLELCPGLGGRTVALRGSRQRSPGRDRLTAAAGWLPTGGAHGPGRTPTLGRPERSGGRSYARDKPGWEPAPGPAARQGAETQTTDRRTGAGKTSPGSCGRRRAPQRFPRLGPRRPQRAGPCSRADLGI